MKSEETIIIRVNKEDFDNLIGVLERAHRKGYMPDSMIEEWETFNWEIINEVQ